MVPGPIAAQQVPIKAVRLEPHLARWAGSQAPDRRQLICPKIRVSSDGPPGGHHPFWPLGVGPADKRAFYRDRSACGSGGQHSALHLRPERARRGLDSFCSPSRVRSPALIACSSRRREQLDGTDRHHESARIVELREARSGVRHPQKWFD